MGGVAEVAARAGVHCGDEHKVGGVGGFCVGAGDGDGFVFERLAEGFEDGTGKLRNFIEEENAEMCEGDFAWGGFGAATDDGNCAGGVMWGAKWAGGDYGVGGVCDGMDFSDGNLLSGRGRGE